MRGTSFWSGILYTALYNSDIESIGMIIYSIIKKHISDSD